MNTNVWKPVTEFTPKPSDNPLDHPMKFELTPQERDIAVNARLDILAMKRAQGQFTPGLVAKPVSQDELTPAERVAFGMEVPK